MSQIKAVLFILLLAPSLCVAELFTNKPVEGFVGYQYDLDKQGYFYGMTVGQYYKYISFNTILYGEQDQGSAKAIAEELEVASTSVTFHTPQVGSFVGRFTIGRVVLPIGMYESQRVYPNAFSNRSISDSFIVNAYSSYYSSAALGELLEIDLGNFTFQVGRYQPEVDKYDVAYDPRSGVAIEQALENFDIDLITDLTGTISDLLEVGGIFDTSKPVFIETDLEKETFFYAVTYDDRQDMIVDLEYIQTENNLKLLTGDAVFNETLVKLGVERTYFKRLITFTELNYAKIAESGLERYYGALGASYDLNQYVLHTSAIYYSGEGLNSSEFNIGASFFPANRTNVRVMYRMVDTEYTPKDNLYKRNAICDNVCQIARVQNDNGVDYSTPTSKFQKSGLEFRIVQYF